MADTMNGPELHPDTVKLAQGANYGSITTMLPSGRLQTQMIWVHTDGERLVVKLVPSERGKAPESPRVPSGPSAQETSGDRSPTRRPHHLT